MINLNSELKIKDLKLKNRVVVPPMASQTADSSGYVTPQTITHYRRLASSGAAMIMVEYTYVHNSGKSEEFQLGISSDKHHSGLKKLSRAIRCSGAIPAIQLTHAGGKTKRSLTDGRLLSPSGLPVPVKDTLLENPDRATLYDINLIKESFILAALRAFQSGFEVIEIHAAHGYGINQWLSPITNQRNDLYGSPEENRFRILIEIVESIIKEIPQIILSVRIPGMDHIEGGFTHENSLNLSKKLEQLGVQIINVSSGIGGWRRPKYRQGEGYLVKDAALIQKETQLPVIGVGGIKSAEYINEALKNNHFSLAAVGRAILNEPLWGQAVGLK